MNHLNDDSLIPDNIEREVADLLVSGREFDVGARRFKVKRVARGSMSAVGGQCVPLIRADRRGVWHLGLYEDPDVNPSAPLLVSLELERLR